MNELVYLKRNDAFTDSMVIAEGTGVAHRKIKNAINKYRDKIEVFGKLSAPYKAESHGGRPEEYYQLNEQQATFLITLLKNTDIVVAFKGELVNQFFQMRKFIAEKQTALYVETRQAGKLTRKSETDVIKELVEYAKAQGSTHADKLYITYTKLANSLCGVKKREHASISQLHNLSIFENLILSVIRSCIEKGLNYKEIYKECKSRCTLAKEVALIGG